MNVNFSKEEWNNFYRNKIKELERQIQMLKTIENLQTTQLEITKQIRRRIKKEITELKLQIDDEQLETTGNINSQT